MYEFSFSFIKTANFNWNDFGHFVRWNILTSSWKIFASSSPIVRFRESSLSTMLVSSLSDSATVNCKFSWSFSVSADVSLTSLLSAAGFCSSTSSSFSSGSSSAFFEVSSSSSPPFAYQKTKTKQTKS